MTLQVHLAQFNITLLDKHARVHFTKFNILPLHYIKLTAILLGSTRAKFTNSYHCFVKQYLEKPISIKLHNYECFCSRL